MGGICKTETSLQSVSAIEGSLIATYRALDWNGAVGGGWGNSASNWGIRADSFAS